MAGPLLTSEPLQRYRALGLAGDPVWRAAPQLRAAITQRLSREHADLLAIPEADPSGRRIDWYAPFDGEVRRLADLGESERNSVAVSVQRLHGDLATLAESMEAPQRSGAERNFARLLRNALTAPGEETLYVVDGKPVMTFWGFSADAALPGAFLPSAPVVPQPIAPAAATAAAAPEAVLASAPALAPAIVVERATWWQWLLLALLLLLLLAGLAYLLRPYLPHLESRLEAEARDRALEFSVRQPVELQNVRLATLQQDNENLRIELARLTDALAHKGGDCAAGLVVPGTVIGVVPDGKPIERGPAVDEKGKEIDLASKPDEKAPDGSKPDAQKGPDNAQGPNDKGPNDKGPNDKGPNGPDKSMANKDKKKDEPKPMVVPPDAKQKQELGFLKGDWRSRTGLATATGEKDIRPSYTLDDKGKGKVSFVQHNGATCEAPAEARWDNGKLVIEEKSNPKCTDGHTYARNTVNCEVDKDGVAQCKGSQPGDKRSYNVQIGR
ncbi:MAG TPA: SrfA family protein [Reyranella sp.]|jgi:hypothetical protein|nr:SrfA family protein [Reyranella sp.]